MRQLLLTYLVDMEKPGIKSEVLTPAQGGATTTRPAKKKIETALPLGKITEKTPVAPKPKETSSLPTGSFCSRCGNRVPFKSTFCNHCGTPIKQSSEHTSASKPVITQVPVPPPESNPVVTESHVAVPPHQLSPSYLRFLFLHQHLCLLLPG